MKLNLGKVVVFFFLEPFGSINYFLGIEIKMKCLVLSLIFHDTVKYSLSIPGQLWH
jgi:hypothetical protein